MEILYAAEKDIFWLQKNDQHISLSVIQKKIRDQEIMMVKDEKEVIGYLRFNFFWDEYPFLTMLFISENFQNQGIGKKLLHFWELEMKKQGYKFVMTSSEADEGGQHFYRKMGYKDIGSLDFPNQVNEIFFLKIL